MSFFIERSRDQEAVRWGLVALAFLSWLFTLISVNRCTFMLSGEQGTPNQLLYAWGLFSTPSYRDGQQGEHNLLGCIPYPSDVKFDRTFKVARGFGAVLALLMTCVLLLIASIQLFLPRQKSSNFFGLFRAMLVGAMVCQLLTFCALGADFCVRVEDTGYMKIPSKCVPGAAGIVALFNIIILCLMGILSLMVPPPKHPFFEIRRYRTYPSPCGKKEHHTLSGSTVELEEAMQRGKKRSDDANSLLDSIPPEIVSVSPKQRVTSTDCWEDCESQRLPPPVQSTKSCATGVKSSNSSKFEPSVMSSNNDIQRDSQIHSHERRDNLNSSGSALGDPSRSSKIYESSRRRDQHHQDRDPHLGTKRCNNTASPLHSSTMVDREISTMVLPSTSVEGTAHKANNRRTSASSSASNRERRRTPQRDRQIAESCNKRTSSGASTNRYSTDGVTLSGQTTYGVPSRYTSSAGDGGGGCRTGQQKKDNWSRETVKVTVEHYPGGGKKTHKEITYPDGSKKIMTTTETMHVDGSKTVTTVVEEIDSPGTDIETRIV